MRRIIFSLYLNARENSGNMKVMETIFVAVVGNTICAKNRLAFRLVRETTIGLGLASVKNAFGPEIILIGEGAAQIGPLLAEEVKKWWGGELYMASEELELFRRWCAHMLVQSASLGGLRLGKEEPLVKGDRRT